MVHAVIALLALQQPLDSAYTAKIRELTTEPRFNTELTDHLPADPRVPTPFKVLGYVPGTVGRLSYVADITRYFRALDEASPRVRVFDLGTSDEGRPLIVAAIADSATITQLDRYRDITAALADPRRLTVGDTGELRARVQHDPELERFGRELAHGAEADCPASGGARRRALDFINRTVDEIARCHLS